MTTKEKLKRKLDALPDSLLKEVEQFISSIETKNSKKKKVRTFKLKGQFDNVNIRHSAYE